MIIKEITEITNQIVNLDGEEVYVLDKRMDEGISKLKYRAEMEKDNYILAMLKRDIEFICGHPKFAIAFRPVKKRPNKWLPCLIYKYEGEWRRVICQYANCLKCDWGGTIANPTNPDLYVTLENEFDVLKKINRLNFCKCPKCGNEISSKAIWTENEKE